MSRKLVLLKLIVAVALISQTFLLAQCACYPRKYQSFFDLPVEEQHEQFRTYPLEMQFDIFVYDVNCHHPSTKFGSDIVMRGEEAIPFLKERFAEAKPGVLKMLIMGMFAEMSITGYADLRDHEDLLAYLEKEVASMHPFYRNWGERELQFIRGTNETLDWEDAIAERGEEAIPDLKEQLEKAQSEWDQVTIIRLFAYMSVGRHGDLRKDKDLLAFLEKVVSSMKDPVYKRMAERELHRIKETNEELNREEQ